MATRVEMLFRQECVFVAGAATPEAIPDLRGPEAAFIGRSNAGKSSLINALTGRNSLARTSQSPGHTQQLNFFVLAGTLTLVDMPGYGFAKVSKKQLNEWDLLIRSYLCGRPNLKRAFVLVDARRGLMPPDEAFMAILDEAAVSFQVVLTKADTLTQAQMQGILRPTEKALQSHPACHPEVIAASAVTRLGIAKLRAELAALI